MKVEAKNKKIKISMYFINKENLEYSWSIRGMGQWQNVCLGCARAWIWFLYWETSTHTNTESALSVIVFSLFICMFVCTEIK